MWTTKFAEMQINSASQISPPFSYYDDEKFVLFCPSIELIFITHSQLIRQGRIVRLCLQINNTRTHNRQWQWSDHEIEDRSWFLYQVSAFPCVTAMGWAAHGPGWRADWIYWGEIYVSRITPWLGPGSRSPTLARTWTLEPPGRGGASTAATPHSRN